jgi:hypothetical protein
MKRVKFEGTIENAYGKSVSPALNFEGFYDAFENPEECRNRGEWPKDSEVLDWRNSQRKANERQKSMTAALTAAGYEKPTLESDVQLQLKSLIKTYMAAKKTFEEAKAIAESTLGATLEE